MPGLDLGRFLDKVLVLQSLQPMMQPNASNQNPNPSSKTTAPCDADVPKTETQATACVPAPSLRVSVFQALQGQDCCWPAAVRG